MRKKKKCLLPKDKGQTFFTHAAIKRKSVELCSTIINSWRNP